jgi:hypothetical protein
MKRFITSVAFPLVIFVVDQVKNSESTLRELIAGVL